jgi:hypothetical protein
MNAKQLERASYLAAHAVLSADISASHLGTPGARRSYVIDSVASEIRRVFELHCSALDESTDWWTDAPSIRQSAGSSREPARITKQQTAGSQNLQLVMPDLH